jgi:hypothetical protein
MRFTAVELGGCSGCSNRVHATGNVGHLSSLLGEQITEPLSVARDRGFFHLAQRTTG